MQKLPGFHFLAFLSLTSPPLTHTVENVYATVFLQAFKRFFHLFDHRLSPALP